MQHFLLFLFLNCNIFYYNPFSGEKLQSYNMAFLFLFHMETLRFQTARFFGVALRQLQHFLLFCRVKCNIFYYISR